MAQRNDALLVKRLKDKDPAAMDDLVNLHGGKIYHLALGILKKQEDAEDVLQETLLKVFEKIDTFRGDSALSSWMYRIAVNFSYMKIRKNRRNDYIPLEEHMPQFQIDGMHHRPVNNWAEKGETQLLRTELKGLLIKNIDSLSEKYKTILVLRDIEGFSTEEVADMTGITIPAVKSRLHRARLFLREKLSEYHDK